MKKKFLILVWILYLFLVLNVNAQLTNVSETVFDNLNLSTLTCDDTNSIYVYKNDYSVIWDHFHNTKSYDLFLWKYRSMSTWNYFRYNITNTDLDSWTNVLVFNRPLLRWLWRKVSWWQTIRQWTTAEDYAPDDNASFADSSWAFVSGWITDSLDWFTFNKPNVRNYSTPSSPSTWNNYDDIYKSATLYDEDNNINTISDNSAIILCNTFVVRWCWDWRLGFTWDDWIAWTADDEDYYWDIYHWEECDDGNNNDNDWCSSTCKLETPNVTLTITPSNSSSSFTWVLDSTKSSRSDYIEFNDGNWNITNSWIVFPISKFYTSTTNASVSVISNYSWLIQPGLSLPTNFTSASVTISTDWWWWWTWVCWDWVINTPNSSWVNEECDDWNTTSWDWCSATCTNEWWWWWTWVCWDWYINGWESCETHQYIYHSQTCWSWTWAYDCSYTSLDPVPTVAWCRASDCRYCWDSTLEDTQWEECDNSESWCNSCSINYSDPTWPGWSWTSVIYEPKKLIWNDQPVYPGWTDKPKLQNVTWYPIYISKEFCVNRFYQKNNHWVSFYPRESINFNWIPLGYCEWPVWLMQPNDFYYWLEVATTGWTWRINDFNDTEKYVDNQVIAWLDNNWDRNFQLDEPNEEKIIRVSIPSVSTVWWWTSMVDSNRKWDLYDLASDWISDQTKNNNFIVSSLSATSTTNPLSSYTIKSDNWVIKTQAIIEWDNDVSSFNSISASTPTSTIYNISWFNNYNWLTNVYYYRWNVILNSVNIIGGNKTFIIDWNFKVNWNITSSDSLAFVIKWGSFIIWNWVTRLDWVYISMDDKIEWDWIQTSNQLLVNWALYGNIDDLVRDRTYISDNWNWLIDVWTVVHYTSKVYTTPPPMLWDFIWQYMEVWKVSSSR